MKRTGPTNENLQKLIKELKKNAIEKKVKLWKRIATELEKPKRQKRQVNLYVIDKNTNEGETALVPGKILSIGNITKKISISSLNISKLALDKINKANAKYIPLAELLQK